MVEAMMIVISTFHRCSLLMAAILLTGCAPRPKATPVEPGAVKAHVMAAGQTVKTAETKEVGYGIKFR